MEILRIMITNKWEFPTNKKVKNNRSVEIMTWTRPIPVSMSEIEIGKQYYTCSYSGPIKITIIKIFYDTRKVLVKLKRDKYAPFVRSVEYIFLDSVMARSAGRNWEHDERKRKRKAKMERRIRANETTISCQGIGEYETTRFN